MGRGNTCNLKLDNSLYAIISYSIVCFSYVVKFISIFVFFMIVCCYFFMSNLKACNASALVPGTGVCRVININNY